MARPRMLVLWSAPRSRSTAFFRMMCERGDHRTVHEPFSYLAEFGETTVEGQVVRSERQLLEVLRALSRSGPLFLKDTTDERYADVLADERFLRDDATHTFLIRHPAKTIPSYYSLNPDVRLDQIGFAHQYEIFVAVTELSGRTPVVMDGDDLVSAPDAIVAAYCEQVGIPHRPDALTWRAGARPEWAPSARWHVEVSRSSGFTRHSRQPELLNVEAHPVLSAYLRHHLPYYERMHQYRLRPGAPATPPMAFMERGE